MNKPLSSTLLCPEPTTTNPRIAAACDRTGENCASDFTTMQSAEYRRLVHLADIGATVLIEAYARRVSKPEDRPQVFDVSTPDEEELPDEKTRDAMASDLQLAERHLGERGMLVRALVNPHWVAIRGSV